MERWRKNLTLLIVGAFLASASYSMVVPFLPLFLLEIGVHRHVELWAGFLFSVSYLAGALVAPYWGQLADRFGRRQMLLRAGFGLTAVYFATGLVTDRWELLALRLAQGLLSGYIPGSITLIATSTPEGEVGWALSWIASASATGNIVGPLLGGVLARFVGSRIAFMSAGGVMLIAALIALFWVREDHVVRDVKPSRLRQDVAEALRNVPLATVLLLTLCTYLSIMTIEPVLPLYIVQLGGSTRDAPLLAGVVFSISGIAAILFAPRWGRLGDRVGFRVPLLVGLVGGGLGNLAQIPFHTVIGFTVVRFVYGAFFAAVFPALNGLIVQATAADFRGRAFGLSQSASQIGTMLGPLVGGVVAGSYGIHNVFWLTGLLLLATSLLSARTRPAPEVHA